MGQYKFYIRYNWSSLLFGFTYNKRYEFEIHLLFFTFGKDFAKGAKGFGIYKWW